MDYHGIKSVLNRYLARHTGGERRPVFFDISSTYPELDIVTRSFPAIRAEFDALFESGVPLPSYHEVDKGEEEISNTTARRWTVFMLDVLGHKPKANRALCPATCRALDRVPNLLQAFFSVLEPGKCIPQHVGPYLGYLRYHLALRVPAHNPPTLKVAAEEYVWKPGEAVLFDDTWPHAVENHSDDVRCVLVVDVLRPLPAVPTLVNRLTTMVARQTYGRKLAKNVQQFATTGTIKKAA
jgi:aspartate beta-hydroxylase/beta-hydroxylase